MDRNIAKIHNGLQLDGKDYTINSVALTVLLKNANGDVVLPLVLQSLPLTVLDLLRVVSLPRVTLVME